MPRQKGQEREAPSELEALVTLSLDKDTAEELLQRANVRGMTVTDLILEYIAFGLFKNQQEDKGINTVLRTPEGKLYPIEIEQ